MANKILVVDDDINICEIIEFNLKNEGFDVDSAYSAEEALKKLTPDYSLILLDVMMSGMSGYKLAERLRNEGNQIPIIFLTAKDTENDMLTGFSVGGDDYISKPFSIKEVIARIKAVIKRHETISANAVRDNKLVYGSLEVDFELKEISIDGEVISLTKTEYEVFTFLATNPDKIFSRDDIITTVWSETQYITERTVDVHITRLRKKLGDYASLITNRAGYGYRFDSSGI